MEPALNHPNSQSVCNLIPLGGLGEIGKNMTALECDGQILVVDAGLAFPTEDQPGIDLIIPDITYLKENGNRVLGIVLTHGHEDHVGALPYILHSLQVPVYGTRMTLGIVRNKLEEHDLLSSTDLIEIRAGGSMTLGPFYLDFIRVTHSIVDGIGLGITTPAGIIVHTGDFKLDQTPVDGEVTDLGKFAELGRKGVALLLADSTNVERPGYPRSPAARGRGLLFQQRAPLSAGREYRGPLPAVLGRAGHEHDQKHAHGSGIGLFGNSGKRLAEI
jgi:ribonuclease J